MGCKELPTYYPVGIFIPFQSDHHCVSYTVGSSAEMILSYCSGHVYLYFPVMMSKK
ncbi:uncharacterized protein [Aegilops tauschii subsp. strangulata]|uniref:uncharacterized protein n=1 Tax=Triticum aestivum TaxID=4565 RepID=UPI001ABD18A6|nr:uncharacterized protein LOC120970780 [Aegilops tauschii subsp. strangulata]XP_044373217.1 uncharacterized protein LOC123095726 [Triticum aestivum]